MNDRDEKIIEAESDTDSAKKKLIKETREQIDQVGEILKKYNPQLVKDTDAPKDKICL